MQNKQSGFIAIVLAIIFALAIVGGGALYLQKNDMIHIPIAINNNTPTQITPITQTVPTTPATPETTETLGVFTPPFLAGNWTASENTTNVNWKGYGLKMDDLKLVVGFRDDLNTSPQSATNVSYYDMGNNGNSKIILASIPPMALGGPSLFFFEQIDGGYRFMAKVSTRDTYNSDTKYGYVLSSKVLSADTTTFYAGVVGPTNFKYKGTKLSAQYLYPSDFFSVYVQQRPQISISKVDTNSFGDLYLQRIIYKAQDNITPQFYSDRYILKLLSGLYTEYNTAYDFFSDNSVPDITWNDGTKNKDTYHADAHMGGCGNPGSSITAVQDVSNSVQQTGTTSTGDKIYELKDINNPIVKFFYDLSGGTYNEATQQFDKIPMQDWYTHHPVVFYKNSLGNYVIFTNDKYGIQAECGKPVIYLYPTQTENIKVQVGADITKSEPLYNNGWQVSANSDGTLTNTDGVKYDSLFWEGIGHGDYPNITEGFVVTKDELKNTIQSQLKELGLSNKESADFLDFWLPKMPDTPYTRLTWFTTQQMNKLAPLAISPKPNTVIRVFLDFQGLQSKISIPAQKLTSLPRNGFTVVEWGGILNK